MDQGVTALIIVGGMILGFAGLGVAGRRRRMRQRKEADDLGRRLGARWFTSDTGLPYGWVHDPITGNPYSGTGRLFDRAFAAEYRGRRVVALEYSTVRFSAESRSRTHYHSIQVLGPQTPLLLVLPRDAAVAGLWPDLTEVPVGPPEFDDRYLVLVKDPAQFPGIPAAATAWFLARPAGRRSIIVFTGDGFAVTAAGPLPGWDTIGVINDLVDLCDLVETGQPRPSAPLELTAQPPPHNRVLTTLSGCLLGATLVFWLAMFTISNPSSGLVVIGVLAGLLAAGLGLGLLVRRRRRSADPAGPGRG